MYQPDICIYHGGCADGFTAAWAVWTRYGDKVEYIPAIYNQAPPVCVDKHVLIVDFSYKKAVLHGMSCAAKSITILDHHKTSAADLEEFAVFNPVTCENIDEVVNSTQPGLGNIRAIFNQQKSGAVLAWEFCRNKFPPKLSLYVQDRDLWRHEFRHTKEINAAIASYEFEFHPWDNLACWLETPKETEGLIAEGKALLRKQQMDIKIALAASRRMMMIGGHIIPVGNLPYIWASEGGHLIAKETGTFGACYFDRADGKRQFSLRSVGNFDVEAIAKSYGGGGHRNAAGFEASAGWEGAA